MLLDPNGVYPHLGVLAPAHRASDSTLSRLLVLDPNLETIGVEIVATARLAKCETHLLGHWLLADWALTLFPEGKPIDQRLLLFQNFGWLHKVKGWGEHL